MNFPIRTAVIGAGSMGANHARVLSELPESRLVGILDTNPDTAERISRSYNAPGFTDLDQMLATVQPEAVTIAVPTELHAGCAMTALEAGAHVLVEKPIAATLKDGKHMIEQARALNRLLMVGHIVRFNPAIQALRAKLQNQELGRIFQITCRRVGPFPARIRDVGVVIDLATHDLDLMRYLIGLDPVRVYAETEQHIHTAHEDLLIGLMRFPADGLNDSICGMLEINWLTPAKVREVLVLGERGLLKVDDLTQDLYYYENTFQPGAASVGWSNLQHIKGVSEGSMTRIGLQRYEPLKAELQAFLHAIQHNEPAPVPGEDGLAALHLAHCLIESARCRQVVEVHGGHR